MLVSLWLTSHFGSSDFLTKTLRGVTDSGLASPGDDAAEGTRLAASSQLCERCSAGRNKKQ